MKLSWLPPREREIADIVYASGEASAAEVCRALSDPLSNAAVRSMLGRLERKGVLRRRKQGNRHYYAPAATDLAAREVALLRVGRDYFGGALGEMAAMLLEMARREEAGMAPTPGTVQAPLPIHQATPPARRMASRNRQAGAERISAEPSGPSPRPESIGPIRFCRLTNV